MSDLVCLECGKEMEYDWAPCPHCGWKAPGAWEESGEEPEGGAPASRHGALRIPGKWIRLTAWCLLAAFLTGLVLYLIRLFDLSL